MWTTTLVLIGMVVYGPIAPTYHRCYYCVDGATILPAGRWHSEHSSSEEFTLQQQQREMKERQHRRKKRKRRQSIPSWLEELEMLRQQQEDQENFRNEQADRNSFGIGYDSLTDDDDNTNNEGDDANDNDKDSRTGQDNILSDSGYLSAPFVDFTSGKGQHGSTPKGKGKSGDSSGKGKTSKGSSKKTSSQKTGKGKGKGKGKGYEQGTKSKKGKGGIFDRPSNIPQPTTTTHPSPSYFPTTGAPSVQLQQPQPIPPPLVPAPRATPPPQQQPDTVVPTVSPSTATMTLPPTSTPSRMPTLTTLAPIVLSPNVSTTTTPTLSPGQNNNTNNTGEVQVMVPNYFIAFVAPLADREPTDDEYQLITELTTLYFEEVFAAIYINDPDVTFVRVNTVLESVQYNAGIPEPRFNIYMSFETSIVFDDSTSRNDELPTGKELLDIMFESIGTSYIVDYVWQAPESPFISVQEVLLKGTEVMNIIPTTTNETTTTTTTTTKTVIDTRGPLSALLNRFIFPGSTISLNLFRNDDNQ